MMNIKEMINDLDLANGMTKRINCPVCHGHKTFTVTNNMGSLVWNCYKVSCGTKGGKRINLSVEDIRDAVLPSVVDIPVTPFVLPEYIVPHNDRSETTAFASKWGLNADEVDMRYDVKENRVVFLVKHDGLIVDAIGRAVGNRLPKWKRYGTSDLPFVYGYGSVAVVVEDCVSAMVVGSLEQHNVLVGVAVLGTSLSDSHKRYLSRFSNAIVALDPDALTKTLSFAKDLRGYVNDVKVLRLKDDLKYRLEEDIINLNNTLTLKEI